MKASKHPSPRPSSSTRTRARRATTGEVLSPVKLPATQSTTDQWACHRQALLRLRESLLAAHGNLRESTAEPLEPHSMSEADSATDEFDHTLALTMLSAEEDALHEIDAALQRIADGSYGICEQSSQPIAAERLRAIPWTRFTREIEERLESSGAIRRPRLTEARTVRGDGQPWRSSARKRSRSRNLS
jgi:RNA polymerase-binding transcription factor DksA